MSNEGKRDGSGRTDDLVAGKRHDSQGTTRLLGWVLIASATLVVIASVLVLSVQMGAEPADLPAARADAGVRQMSQESEGNDRLAMLGDEMLRDRPLEEEAVDAEAVARTQAERDSASELPTDVISITTDFRDSFVHGEKPAQFQKYIVLHDTEGSGAAESIVDWWDSNGRGVAAHFIINKDGTIIQCVDMDKIAHHAGYGDTGHNTLFGVEDESRDDKVGTTPIGSWAADYGMNSFSIGIELVHVGGEGTYPESQLSALDGLIAYIDAHYGFESQIIDHKDWRTGNSDTSPEFSSHLQNYKVSRIH